MFPNVKYEKTNAEKQTAIDLSLSFFVEEELYAKASELIGLFLPRCKFTKGTENSAITAIKSAALADTPEGYTLAVKDGKTAIEYYTYAGLRNALATFSLIVKEKDGALYVADTEIKDYPEVSYRGIMLDLARGVMPIERLFEDMVLIAKSRHNVLHLHLADSRGVAIEMDCLPEEYRIADYYTKEKVAKLVRLADVLGLELIPEFDMPAHSTQLNTLFPELACEVEGDKCLWAVCAGTEAVYELYEKIIAEMISLFPGGRYFHMGGDELEFLDFKKPIICHWDECPKCRKKMKEQGLADKQELYYYFTNRINEIAKANGRQLIMWSDQIDCTRPAGLSMDILMQFWRVAARGRGPHDGCSLEGQLNYGYMAINSYYPNTYIDMEQYLNAENFSAWRWDEIPEVSEAHKSQIVGGEICAWEYGNRKSYTYYDHSLPSVIVMSGDKFWNGLKREYGLDEEIAVTRAVLGAAVPDRFNVFGAIGDIYPPRSAEKPAYVEKIRVGKSEIERIIEVLSDASLFDGGDKSRSEVYKKCAEFALENLL
jgi:hypothetical protein